MKTIYLPAYGPLVHKAARLSVDTPEDLDVLRTIYARLNVPAGEASLVDVLALLDQDPELRAINAHIRQKPLTEVERPAGAGRLGLGTVQFGQAYGISNQHGKVQMEEARSILSRAARA